MIFKVLWEVVLGIFRGCVYGGSIRRIDLGRENEGENYRVEESLGRFKVIEKDVLFVRVGGVC